MFLCVVDMVFPIFAIVLAGKTFNLADNAQIASGVAVAVLGSGLLGYRPKTMLLPVMPNNFGTQQHSSSFPWRWRCGFETGRTKEYLGL